MKLRSFLVVILCVAPALVMAGASGGGAPVTEVEGIAVISSVEERSCIALRVDVPEGKALSGIHWHNGSSGQAFPKILVASGSGDLPPEYDSAIVMAEDITGQENAMSELVFNEPVASLTESLFVIMQFPANYLPPEEGMSMGVGYSEGDGQNTYYLSSDGDSWFPLSSNYDFLLTPDYVDWSPNFLSLSAPGDDSGPDQGLIPVPERTNFVAYPNPFNPETH